MNSVLERHPAAKELQKIILKLDMVSHASAAPLGQSSKATDEDIGGRRPSGGLDRKGDREPEYRQKTAEYFRRHWVRVQTVEGLTRLLSEAQDALEAWQRTPLVAGQPMRMDDPQWKRWVAESELSGGEIARLYGVSRQYVHQVRSAYK